MTDREILQKAIDKAKKSGWRWNEAVHHIYFDITVPQIYEQISYYQDPTSNDIIFSHDFAKAFWGEDGVNKNGDTEQEFLSFRTFGGSGWVEHKKRWQYLIQIMVLKENPIKYLENFL